MAIVPNPSHTKLPHESPPCEAPDQLLVPRSGLFLIVLNERPFAKSFFQWYMFLGLIGYCAFIAVAHSLQWRWLPWWIDLWRPAVHLLRQFIPLFDNIESTLVARGAGFRIDAIHHLIAFNWIVTSAILAYVVWTVSNLTRADWCRLVVVTPRRHLKWMFVGGVVMLCIVLYWATIGFALDGGASAYRAWFAFHQSDFAFVGIGIFFVCIDISILGMIVSLGALIVGMPRKKWIVGND